ncbi:MAG: apolipoprotein N-acyltransferase [Phycisphaerales bacterium]|nr:MAG: apolipoprotein N-acyltransferase [Phycisphaerales bacterium]
MKRKSPPKRKKSRQPQPRPQPVLDQLGIALVKWWHLILLALGTFLLKSLIFAPISFWPLSFVCLVPWLVMIGAAGQARRVYWFSFALGLVFFFWNMRWLCHPTGLGYCALAIYLSVFFPLVACPIRHAVRRHRLPLALVVPVVWTGSELVRAVALTGFPWFFLAHSPYKVLTLIQVSDLVGAYGVSFLIASVNGAVADVIFAWIASRRAAKPGPNIRQARFSVLFAGVLLAFVCVYGWVQLARDTVSEGPKIAILQGDFISRVEDDGPPEENETPEKEKKRIYFEMMRMAAQEQPGLYLLPESPWFMCVNPEARDRDRFFLECYDGFLDHAVQHGAYIVTGCHTSIPTPNDLVTPKRGYNSAAIFRPDGGEPGRYDKVHLVVFGEYVPFRFGRLRFLYFWLNRIMPFSYGGKYEYSMFPGTGFHTFEMQARSQEDRLYRFGIPICYEDVMPYISRRFTRGDGRGKQADFLLNISNDGWFGRGIQQPQHLAICVFRAVENRVGVARAVNTGVSAFIEPTGRIHDVVTGDPQKRWGANLIGYRVARLGVDSRYSLYTRYGDWFGWSCAILWLIAYIDYLVTRVRTRSEHENAAPKSRAVAARRR